MTSCYLICSQLYTYIRDSVETDYIPLKRTRRLRRCTSLRVAGAARSGDLGAL